MNSKQSKFLNSIPISWREALKDVCATDKINSLISFLKERELAGAKIYPSKNNIFAALKATHLNDVKVVIVGQDPYHGPGQAHGLSFSVQDGIPLPPSLKNIFKEIKSDLGISLSNVGNLSGWARQGVLLLNSILTVEESTPAAHAGKGWELFTDEILKSILIKNTPTVFILWGAYAQKKVQNLSKFIDPDVHMILKSAHPSPLSVTRFLGCKHFSKANQFLTEKKMSPIDWARL